MLDLKRIGTLRRVPMKRVRRYKRILNAKVDLMMQSLYHKEKILVFIYP